MAKRNYLKTQSISREKWIKRLMTAAGFVAGALLLWSAIFGEMGVIKYYRMSILAASLRSDIDRLQKDNVRLSREVAALKTSPAYIERLARDKIGLSRPGEVVYFYGDPLK